MVLSTLKSAHYLLIEDSPSDAALIETTLSEGKTWPAEGIWKCSTLESGIDTVRQKKFTIVLLDLNLPDSQGIETFRAFHRAMPDVPVIILTAAIGEDIASQAIDEGAQDVIFKDRLDPYWITHAIRRAICRQDLQIRVRAAEEREVTAAKKANQAKTDFLSATSHEIRTPISAIVMAADALLDSQSLGDNDRSLLAMIERNGEYLLKILNDILDLARVEAGCLIVEKKTVNLRNEIAHVVDAFMLIARAKNIRLTWAVSPNVTELVWTDPTRFSQVLSNLVANSLKFTEVGSVKVEVFAMRRESRDWVAVAVTDTGIGISDDQATKLFRAFSQADASIVQRFGGSGLGLSIAKHLARMLGGDVKLAESAPGHGSTFIFELPVNATFTRSDNCVDVRQMLTQPGNFVGDHYNEA